jgi:hypothetical protein
MASTLIMVAFQGMGLYPPYIRLRDASLAGDTFVDEGFAVGTQCVNLTLQHIDYPTNLSRLQVQKSRDYCLFLWGRKWSEVGTYANIIEVQLSGKYR